MEELNLFLLAEDNPIDLNIVMNVIEDLVQPIVQDNNEHRVVVVRNRNFAETVVPRYPDTQFKKHFRMCRGTFEYVLQVVGNRHPIIETVIPLQKKLLFSIWMLSTPESFRAAGDRFSISDGTGHYIFKEIIEILAELVPEYIKWPDNALLPLSENVFAERSRGFPGVIGAIDGTHIYIKQPINNANDYFNRHNSHSIILQGTCNHSMTFIDVSIGMPGRMHDARVFRNSNIYARIMNENHPLIPSRYHLLGDAAYPLLPNLMTPFRDNGHLTLEQSRYNTRMSTIRSVIERVFGLLKGKFRRLKYLDVSDMELANNMIASCCVLHNILIMNNDVNIEEDVDYINEAEIQFNNEGVVNDRQRQVALEKRDYIVNILN